MKVLVAALLALLFAGPAVASSCADAQRALASAEGGSGGGANAAALRNQAKAYGCGKMSVFGRAPQCAAIESQLRRASGAADARTVRRLRAEVASACAPARPQQRVARTERRPARQSGEVILHGTREDNALDGRARGGNFLTRLFGGAAEEEIVIETVRAEPSARRGNVERVELDRTRRRRDAAATGGGDVNSLATGSGRKPLREGGYRTVCVRLCDGFYFPINSRSHSDNFFEELAMCVGRCPGADVSLYVHGSGDAADGMRSAMTGEPYVRLPTAFAYRKSLVPSCGCEPQTTVASARTADEALSYLGASGESGAEAAAAAASGAADWTPLKAVFDETGQPLDLSLGVDQTAGAGSPALAPADLQAAVSGRGARTALPVAASSVTVDTDDTTEIRSVGGQFYSDAEPGEPARRPAPRPNLLPVSPNAVTVVPVSPTATVMPASPLPRVPAQTSSAANANTDG